VLYLAVTAGALPAADVPAEIEDHAVNSRNRLPARVAIWPAPDAAAARTSRYDASPWVRSLNGPWKFHWSPDPASRPADFYAPAFDVAGWKEIPVPSTWERQGYGVPLYVNYTYPFRVDPPRVMGEPPTEYTTFQQRNPVGSYRRTFEVPGEWKGQRIVLHFAGVSSAFFVWVNGEPVGYSEDSRLPAEFDVSGVVRPGPNVLAVEVYKYCDGSYLEDQDFWRLSGIFRDVFVRAVPAVTLWDAYAQPVLDATLTRGSVRLHVTPANFTGAPAAGGSVSLTLLDPAGKRVTPPREAALGEVAPGFGAHRMALSVDYGAVALWNPERPAVYIALVERRVGGQVAEAYALPVGFRRLELQGPRLLMNGRELKIRGVNRHEFDPDQGYTVPVERHPQDLRLMKQAGINFVRNAHYPNDPRWYALTSEWGMAVLDEANVESHGLSYLKRVLPGDDPVWSAACVERMRRMVIRDRQFPSVLMWSLGNEAGWGSTFLAMRDAAKAADPEDRVIQYADMNRAADLDSQTYPTPAWLLDHVAGKAVRKGERGEETRAEQHGPYPSGRPFLMNEYAHAMGNSVGNFRKYWDVIDANPMLVGGFIWDWVDQALWKPLPGGGKGYVYGGDFGDKPNNLNSCCDGLVDPDRVPHPHYHEVAKVHQPMRFRSASPAGGTVEIANGQLVTNVSEYRLEYEIAHEGVVVDRAERAAPDIPAGETRTVRLFEKPFDVPAEGETFLTMRLRLARDTVWAPAGHVVAWEQLALTRSDERKALPPVAAGDVPHVIEDEGRVGARARRFRALFDLKTCLLSYYATGDRVLAIGMRFNFWRALTDNDRGWKVGDKMGAWRTAAAEAVVDSCHADSTGSTVTITGAVRFPMTGARAELTHVVHGNGAIDIAVRFDLPSTTPELPRLGFEFGVDPPLDRVEWFGRGPHESYVDRMESAPVGLYRSTVSEWVTPYVRPQENGNRTAVRRVSFVGADGHGLTIQAPSATPLSVSAWPYDPEELDAAKHDDELPRSAMRQRGFGGPLPHFTVNLDHRQMGVGGDNSWGAEVHREFRIATGRTYEWTFRMSPK